MLKIFNTLSKQKEIFKPIHKNKVKIYVCGVTTYDLCHIGHGRTFVIFDLIIRYLKNLGYKVEYIRNITDIDDKIINLANEKNINIKYITDKMISEMQLDFKSLNLLNPDIEPRVTDHINEIIIIIKNLIKNNYAYIANNGDVMFSIKSYLHYGQLSRQNLNKLKLQNKKIHFSIKKNYIDFVLWKISKKKQIGWSSPWGYGRPGWHIECSAMSHKYFGNCFDIHGGGNDLIFPHHENEIAQSYCFDKSFHVNYWIHSGMVMINNKKMSKSLHNSLKLRDILSKYNNEVIRYFFTSTHYRSPIIYNENILKQSEASIKRLYTSIYYINDILLKKNIEYQNYKKDKQNIFFEKKFYEAMNDDFNTPKVYSILFNMSYQINILNNKKKFLYANNLILKLKDLGNILGILFYNPKNYFKNNNNNSYYFNKYQIEKLIKIRNNARKNKCWIKADDIRNLLNNQNILLEDSQFGTIWKKKTK
ncbi:cysteine--tRNA ligase [Enterobacteriaceae endosymbiont of Plateumaris sericea]|uniref:cysteine--tRNA ligase n=1 Tax=Enterobacteriaceae endosymbiont of Plateumaris sericea TaxID=2675797 RepID=UPI00144973A9|nr:cysteine--tRNA ligase [Enterobacteriaceae endosymbiont of Plateumaris sericea]QJC29795.1 cysteine--tRNA ligase [Enterobacteriaceae endosymbiont of Plateumaris sericea]